ncbi:MAG: putative sulfate/molybdate transporter [Dehalococcoidales bacterium]|nr:putative sulfate/molybdate transporter [Dehalococcoidales bacterium]
MLMPVQPLKAVSAIAISQGLSASVIGAAGLLMGGILLFLSLTNLIFGVVKLFPKVVVRGIQLSIGLILLRKGVELIFNEQIFINGAQTSLTPGQFPIGIVLAILALAVFVLFKFKFSKQNQGYPASLALLTFGLGVGAIFGPIPSFGNLGPSSTELVLPAAADFWIALTVLVIPQLPLTQGNAVVGTWDTSRVYFEEQAKRVNPRSVTSSMGLANIIVGLLGAMPMCHGSGGLTAHYKLGARTGGANLMIGGLLLTGGLLLGYSSLSFIFIIPLAVLGVLLAIVGIYHMLIIRDLTQTSELAVAGSVAVATYVFSNLA